MKASKEERTKMMMWKIMMTIMTSEDESWKRKTKMMIMMKNMTSGDER